jgi:hypothetical protein
MIIFFKFIGALGIVLISIGIISKKRKVQNILYIIGGLCAEIYSIFISDIMFIILEGIFTIAAVFDFIRMKKNKSL